MTWHLPILAGIALFVVIIMTIALALAVSAAVIFGVRFVGRLVAGVIFAAGQRAVEQDPHG